MNFHINKVCNASFYCLHNIRRIRKHPSRDSSETLIHAFVSSRLDYCNSLFYGLPQVQINKIQRVQNAASRLNLKQPKFCRVTLVLSQLHWLPIKYRTEFKILVMTFKAVHGVAPDYICKLISRKKSTGYSLRSGKKVMLEVPRGKILPTLGVEHSVMRLQSSGTIYPARYPALTLCQILNAMWKHIFLNKLLICRSFYFVYFIVYHLLSFYFILNLSIYL